MTRLEGKKKRKARILRLKASAAPADTFIGLLVDMFNYFDFVVNLT